MRGAPYKITTWDPELGAKKLAETNGVTLMAIYSHAKKHGLAYAKKAPGNRGPYRSGTKTHREIEIWRLVKEFRDGKEGAIRQLAAFGIRASRA